MGIQSFHDKLTTILKGIDRRGTINVRFTSGWPWRGAAVYFSGERRPGLVTFSSGVYAHGAGVRGSDTPLFQSVVTHYDTFRVAAKCQWALPRALRRLSASLRAVGLYYPAHPAAVSFSLARGVRRGAGGLTRNIHGEKAPLSIHQSINLIHPSYRRRWNRRLQDGKTDEPAPKPHSKILSPAFPKRPVSLATSELTRRFVVDGEYHPLQHTSSCRLFFSITICMSS